MRFKVGVLGRLRTTRAPHSHRIANDLGSQGECQSQFPREEHSKKSAFCHLSSCSFSGTYTPMGLPFLTRSAKKRDQIVAIDLGGRTTKAVYLQRRGEGFSLAGFTIHDAPIYEKSISPDLLTEHLKMVTQALGARVKPITLALGVTDSILRQAEMPPVPVADLRLMLKANPKAFLQQELPGHAFDCFVLPTKDNRVPDGEKKPVGSSKVKVLVGGAKQQLVNDLQMAIKAAGLIPDQIVPGLIGPVNAFEMAQGDIFRGEVFALVDLGFKNSTISIISEGDLALNRVVGIGGDKMTAGLAESMGITYAEAEGIKVGMAAEVQSNLEPLMVPLGRELRASIDFFEHQYDKTVGQVFVSGAPAKSEFILQSLQNELMVPCKGWNPTTCYHMALPPQQMAELEQSASQLAIALGAAACSF